MRRTIATLCLLAVCVFVSSGSCTKDPSGGGSTWTQLGLGEGGGSEGEKDPVSDAVYRTAGCTDLMKQKAFAYRKAACSETTRNGVYVYTRTIEEYPSSPQKVIKITTPEDLIIASALCKKRK